MTARYVVIENTPGYLPDADEPAVFEDLDAAREYMREEVERLVDHLCEGYDWREGYEPVVSWGPHPDAVWSAYVTDPEREHDLGRYFEIMEDESDDGA